MELSICDIQMIQALKLLYKILWVVLLMLCAALIWPVVHILTSTDFSMVLNQLAACVR